MVGISLTVALLGFLHCVYSAAIPTPVIECGQVSARLPRIVGGNYAVQGEFPWMVSLQFRNSHYCGGAVINEEYVLTAAHCLHRLSPRLVNVYVGIHSLQNHVEPESNSTKMAVSKFILHPEYSSSTFKNDIALVKLAEPLKWNNKVRPICLPQAVNATEKMLVAAGWGLTKEDGGRSDILRKVELPLVDQVECQEWFDISGKKSFRVQQTHICAGYKNGGKDACKADSGGPLMEQDEKGSWRVVGVVSAGFGCARPMLPGLYTNVTQYNSWIQNNVESNKE